jgi:hypothetical protein
VVWNGFEPIAVLLEACATYRFLLSPSLDRLMHTEQYAPIAARDD